MTSSLLSADEARQRILGAVQPLGEREWIELRMALGRVTAEDVRSTLNIPPYANSAMDGYALAAGDLPVSGTRELRVVGTAYAGRPYSETPQAGECVRIMTGALLPAGADTVVMQEQVWRNGEAVSIGAGHKRGQHVRAAGEDIAAGQVAVPAGKRLTPADLGLLASLGIEKVSAVRRPRVAIFSTGDELRSLGETLKPGEIYDSNRYTVHGMLSRLDTAVHDLGVVRDQREAVRNAVRQASHAADVVISSGGASVGDTDFIKQTLEELGQVDFWQVAMKPGKPLAFGKVGSALFFGLPGNPVSVMATFYQFVQPALRRLMGESVALPLMIKVVCSGPLKKAPGRTEFQRGRVESDANGNLVVHSTGDQGSGILTSMSRANCFIVLPAERSNVEAGSLVDIQLFDGLI
ncbi:MAG: molybdopterin molybdotransferase MoeA [Gammaproteobacteria bacterium]|nr:molybdopterin molybdotransferase MoeA [Gammaproteobacteria bacterium]